MPKSARRNAARRARTPSRSSALPPVEPASTTSVEVSASPLITQRLAGGDDGDGGVPRERRLPSGRATGPKVMAAGDDGATVPLLSYNLPEPTSYSGANVMLLDTEGLRPRTRDTLLRFDGRTYVDCGNPPQLQANEGSSLTIEAWIRTRALDGWRSIVVHGQTTEKAKRETFLRIHDGYYEFGAWLGGEDVGIARNQASRDEADRQKLRVRNEHLGTWVHLAGVYHAQARAWLLYCNGNLLDAVGPAPEAKPAAQQLDVWKQGWNPAMPFFDPIAQRMYWQRQQELQQAAEKQRNEARAAQWNQGPAMVDAPWTIGATRLDPKKNYDRFFDGWIAEVRIWNVARSEAEIRQGMHEAHPTFSPGSLGACWRLNDGTGTSVEDVSGQESPGTVRGEKPAWVEADGPLGQLARFTRRQPEARVEAAFRAAKESGVFDALVFPRVRGVKDQAERAAAVAALARLDFATFRAFYDAGQHLTLCRTMGGEPAYRFVPTARDAAPRLALVEEYTLSSFLGAYGVGRTLKTFSLLPGEAAKITVRTASRSESVKKQASSILDSYSQETASDFESSLQQEQSRKTESSEELEAHFQASASGSWGFGSASVSAGGSASANSSREEFGKSVAASTSKHAAKASANRNVSVETSSQETTTTERSDETVREIRNINVGRTLNFVFRQMNQEYISLLHLVDVRIGYSDGLEPMKEYPLYQLDEVLKRVMIADAPKIAKAKREILDVVENIKDYRGELHGDFVTAVEDSEPARHRVNKDCVMEYRIATTGTARKVAGIIVSATSVVMRTDDVVVEAVIGKSSALDQYAEGLQEQEVRGKMLENEKLELANRLAAAQAAKDELLVELVRNKDAKLLELYNQALTVVPGARRVPTRVVGVWEGGDGGRASAER